MTDEKRLTIRADDRAMTTRETLAEALDRWDAAVNRYLKSRKGGPEGKTAKAYGRTLRDYRDFAMNRELSPWGLDALIEYDGAQNGLRGELKNDTIHWRLTIIQGFFRWAYIHRASPLEPEIVKDKLHKPPRRKLSPRDILDTQEVEAMLRETGAASDPFQAKREHALIRTLADGGLRITEAVSLLAADVYLAGGKWYLFVKGKGDKTREVEIPQGLAHELLALKVADDISLLNMDRRTAWRWVKRVAKRAGVTREVSPHTLRHTHAHTLALLGWPLEAIGARLGHSSHDTTLRYTRPSKLAKALRLPPMPWDEKDEDALQEKLF